MPADFFYVFHLMNETFYSSITDTTVLLGLLSATEELKMVRVV